MNMGSLFDGIGGFPLAGILNGITPAWASEIEAFPIEVTQIRFPDMAHVGDITKLDGAKLPPVDVICGGSPCQDLSVAGARAGLAGERSGLFMEQVRITKEMREAERKRGVPAHLIRPRYLLWENVPGAFSSENGEDYRAVLEEIVRIKDSTANVPRPDTGAWQSAGAIVLGNEFSLAWRVLDAQYWGVAQRRRRIFLVADFTGRSAPQILFKQDCLFGNTPPSSSPWERTSAIAQAGSGDADEQLKAYHINQRDEGIDLNGVAGAILATQNMQMQTFVTQTPIAFASNQRDELRNLHDTAGALCASQGTKQQTFLLDSNCLNTWDTQRSRVFVPDGVAPTLAGSDGGGGRNPGGLLYAAGLISKGNGDCFVTEDVHTSLTSGGGQAGQGYPCVITAGFNSNASAKARSIGYEEETAPTLRASESVVPSVICLNDQGGESMAVSNDITGTLRAQMKGHPPLVMASQQANAEIGTDICPTITSAAGTSGNNQPVLFENHGIDNRYTGPHDVSPTISARAGTGGNNLPLVAQPDEAICIAGNIIDRKPANGGNGFGYQSDVAYTLTGFDRHAVFNRRRSDDFTENDIAATQTARQHKDATDLVCETTMFGQSQFGNYQTDRCSTIRAQGGDYGGGSENLIAEFQQRSRKLIRRLTPLECERLQGFPDGWTDIPGASDSARYKALGNSVAIPCVTVVLRGIAYFLRQNSEE